MIMQKARKLLEQSALLRIFDMLFERQQALCLCELKNLIHHAKKLDIGRFAIFWLLQQKSQRLARPTDNNGRIADNKAARRGTAHDDDFERRSLKQDLDMPALEHIAADSADKDGQDADDKIHEARLC